jgi:hypothetical protein
MKKSLIYITAGIAAVGFAVPAFAAHGDTPEHIVPTQVTVATAAKTVPTAVTTANSVDSTTVTTSAATPVSVEDISGRCDEAEHATDPSCTGVTVTSTDDDATVNSVDDDATENSVDDDATENNVEDVSGPCDEAEHANDPRCTGATATAGSDDSGHDANDDNSAGHSGSDDSGHGGSDD